MEKTKIFHLITSLNIGGTEKYLLKIIKNLNDRYNFSVGYLKELGPIAGEIEKLGVPVTKFGFFQLIKHLKKNKIQIIHTHLYRANLIGRLAAKIAGVPAIISTQQSIDDWKKIYHVWADRLTAVFCDLIIANSNTAKKLLVTREKIPENKIIVSYNGVEYKPEACSKKNNNSITVGYIGRLHREKGAYLIPEIIKKVTDRNKSINFIVAGDGPEKNNIETGISNLKIDPFVKLLGWKNDLQEIYSSIDILLMPSEEESFPQVALDAMAFGIPIVASDVGGVSELVKNNETGLLIKERRPELYAEAILYLVDNPYYYKHFSENSKTKASEFTFKKLISRLDETYKEYAVKKNRN